MLDAKIPPQAVELEEAVLGALIIDHNAIYDVIDVLKPDSFYKPANQDVYSAILDLYNKKEPIDLLTLTDQLRKNKTLDSVGGALYVTQLTMKVNGSQHVRPHAAIVADKAIKRDLISTCSTVQEKCFDDEDDSDDIINSLESDVLSLSVTGKKQEPVHVTSGVKDAINNIERYIKGDLVGIKSGFYRLDKITGGWQNSDLIILGGRTSQGKTLAAIKFISECDVPVLFFSLEMSKSAISTRMICMESGIGNDEIRRGLNDDEFTQVEIAVGKIEKKRIFLDDTPALHINELMAKARRAKMKHDIKMIVIDYLQLIVAERKYRSDSKANEVGIITKALKSIAKELDIPVIALSQLNRTIERSGSRRPMLSDLKESGSIEEDSDLVLFIYRPSYYGDVDAPDDLIELIVAKHRNGQLDTINIKKTRNFTNLLDY